MQTQQVVTLAHEKQWKGENSECHTGDITMFIKKKPTLTKELIERQEGFFVNNEFDIRNDIRNQILEM